jgi:hypothetical protein
MTISPVEATKHLEAQLAAAGLAPTALDPWEGWKTFKAFARLPVAAPDEGVSVQAVRETDPDGETSIILTLMRQFTAVEGDADQPFRWIGMELMFVPADVPGLEGLELWSYDFPDLAAFAASVEAHPGFQAAMSAHPIDTGLVAQEL